MCLLGHSILDRNLIQRWKRAPSQQVQWTLQVRMSSQVCVLIYSMPTSAYLQSKSLPERSFYCVRGRIIVSQLQSQTLQWLTSGLKKKTSSADLGLKMVWTRSGQQENTVLSSDAVFHFLSFEPAQNKHVIFLSQFEILYLKWR